MLFEIAKKIILIFLLLCLVGCTELKEEENNSEDTSIDCGYNYTYGCGFDIMSGGTKCGYGYYYTCRA